MLRIAVPNKGSLSDPAITMLSEAGYRTRRTGRELVLVDEANDVELFFLRPRDIAVYVGQGTVHGTCSWTPGSTRSSICPWASPAPPSASPPPRAR